MPDLAEGAVFAGHRIEGVAGRGGMGTVYRATHIALDHMVALKVIAPDLAGDESFRERFKSESRIAVSLRHPNVVPIHHAGEEEGLLFVTMDLIDGPDLRRLLIARGPLDPEPAVAILEQVAAALDIAHSRGLVHRDIKPGNVLIEDAGGADHAYLTDFGLTKRIEGASEASGLTSTGAFVGTLDYVAPEQIRGEDLDARTDVYALGCVLCEMLAGGAPFADREEKVAKMYAHLQDRPPPLAGAAAPLERVVARAMAKDPDERFPSAGDLARSARAALEGGAVEEEERSVATGPAAPTATHAVPVPTEPAEAPPPPDLDPTIESEALVATEAEPTAVEEPRARRPALLVAGLAVAAVAAVAVAIVLLGSSGSDGGGDGSGVVGTPGQLVAVPGEPVGIAAGDGSVRAVTRASGALVPLRPAGADAPIDLGVGGSEDVAFAEGAWWATALEDGLVVEVDGGGAVVDRLGVGAGPSGIAAAEDGSLWVANADDGTLSRIVPSEGNRVESVSLGEGTSPRGVAADGAEVWVTSRDDDRLLRVGVDGVERRFSVGPNPKGVAVIDGDVWVAASGREAEGGDPGSLWVLERGAGGAEEVPGVNGNLRDVLPAAGLVWVSDGDGRVIAVDPDGRELAGTVDELPRGFSPEDLALGPDGLVWTTSIAPDGGGAIPIDPS